MADIEETIAILETIPFFESLRRRQLANLARTFIERDCEAGEVIVRQGRDGYGFFIVVSGAAEAILDRKDGSKSVVNTFGPSDFFGELALLDDGPRTANVVATESTNVLIMPRENFLGVLRRDGDLAVDVLVELAKRFRERLETC